MIIRTFKLAFPLTLPVMAGYLFLGIGFGVLLQNQGYNYIWAGIMSITIFGGSMQYVAVDLIGGMVSYIDIVIMSIIVNTRQVFYAISMIPKYINTGWMRPLLAFWLTDETFSIVATMELPDGADRNWFYFSISILNHSYWIIGGIIGTIIGSLIPFSFKGIEFAMTSLFVVIFTDQWLRNVNRWSSAIGIIVSILALLLMGSNRFLIPAILIIVFVLVIFRAKMDEVYLQGEHIDV